MGVKRARRSEATSEKLLAKPSKRENKPGERFATQLRGRPSAQIPIAHRSAIQLKHESTSSPPRTRTRVARESLSLEKDLQPPRRKTKFALTEGRTTQSKPKVYQHPPEQGSKAGETSEERVEAYVDQAYRQDLAVFEKDTTSLARGLVNNIRKVSRGKLGLQTLGEQVEGILSKIRQRGYPEPQKMLQAGKDNASKEKDKGQTIQSQAGETTTTTKSKFSRRKAIDRQNIIRDSNIYFGSPNNIFTDLPTFSCKTHSQHDPSLDPFCTWDEDLSKSAVSNEAYFARTIMMTSIFRYRILKIEASLDFNVELEWISPHPLRINHRSGKLEPNVHLPFPKPDLCVGFNRNALFPEGLDSRWSLIPQHMAPFMVPENLTNPNDLGRAFPFLMLEAKGSSAPIGGDMASQQSVIAAAHALYNIWNFMKVTEKLEEEFFKYVLIFTASVHGEEYRLHVHRAVKLAVADGALSKDYPLSFRHTILKQFKGSDYNRVQVQTTVDCILDWALSTLLPKVSGAVSHVCEQRAAERSNLQISPGAVAKAQRQPGEDLDHSTLTPSQALSRSAQQSAAEINSRQNDKSQKAPAKLCHKRGNSQPGDIASAEDTQEQVSPISSGERQNPQGQVPASKRRKGVRQSTSISK